MIQRELWVWTVLCVANLLLVAVYIGYTWGDFKYQRSFHMHSLKGRTRLIQAESNLMAAGCALWIVLCAGVAAVMALLLSTRTIEGRQWAMVGQWSLIFMLAGVPGWVAVKLYTRRKLDRLE